MSDKEKIKLSELTELYDIEDDVNNIAQQNSDKLKEKGIDRNFEMEIEEIIREAEDMEEKEFRDES